MPRDPRKFPWDAREATDAILEFTRGKTWDEFAVDRLLRSAVERQFQIVGDALNQLAKADAALARQIPDLHESWPSGTSLFTDMQSSTTRPSGGQYRMTYLLSAPR